jgi:hypothetical protein
LNFGGDQRVQEQLENTPKRNQENVKRICQDIKDRLPDFSRSAQDCRARIERLKTKYFQTRRDNNKSGGKRKTFLYYDRLDGFLGTRPTVNPVALSDSLINEDEQDSDNETQEHVEGMCILIYYHTNYINRLSVKPTRCR